MSVSAIGLVDTLPAADYTVSMLLWAVLLVFLFANLFWLLEVLLSLRNSAPENGDSFGPAEIQVRVLTIDAEDVVQETVDTIPSDVSDVHVIAEHPIEIDGATVDVVPDSFDCKAVRKGRALEWARRHVPCDQHYILFVDEDSLISEIPPLPDADVVQFAECPTRSQSLFSYLSDLFRIGFQIEQRAFSRLSIPLYAWGGGLAITKELEDEITWNHDTIIEDTVFVWKAANRGGLDFRTLPMKFFNQAPPSVSDMLQQRRRWVAGAVNDLHVLPRPYQFLFVFRTVAWSISPIVPLLAAVSFVVNAPIFEQTYFVLSVVLTAFLYLWAFIGIRLLDESISTMIAMVFLTPLVSILHSIGALLGFVHPTRDFTVTSKVAPSDTANNTVLNKYED